MLTRFPRPGLVAATVLCEHRSFSHLARNGYEWERAKNSWLIDLRQSIDELGKVVGAVVTDDILDRIFQRFCIGK